MIFIICIPIFNITDLISKASVFHPGIYLNKLCVAVLGINDILFGIGLLKTGSRFAALYKIAGILQILTGPFIIIPLGLTQLIGLWLIIPSDLLLIIIIFFEYRESGRINPTVLTSWRGFLYYSNKLKKSHSPLGALRLTFSSSHADRQERVFIINYFLNNLRIWSY